VVPWHTELTTGNNSSAMGTATAGYIFAAIATKEGTSLAVTHDLRGMSLRVVAIDSDGEQHPGTISSGLSVKDFSFPIKKGSGTESRTWFLTPLMTPLKLTTLLDRLPPLFRRLRRVLGARPSHLRPAPPHK
jgi:hypothetical protein